MVDICRTLEQPPPSAISEKPEETSRGRRDERIAPIKLVRVSDRSFDDEFLSNKIISLEVEETARGLSRAIIKIANTDLAFTDHELLEGRNLTVEIFTGYANTTLVKRGKFFAAVPKYAFRNNAMPTITLICYGEEWPLAAGEQREVYENLRDSDIAQRIATRRRLQTDIEQTDPILEHVAQFNMTDMEFLENRALLYGYDVYVEEGILHFHPPRFEHSGLNLLFGSGESGILRDFTVMVNPWVTGASWTKSGLDRITGEEYEFRSQDNPDPLSATIQRRGGSGFQTAAELAEIDGERPRRYIVGDGHELSEAEARAQVEGYTQAAEWIVQGSGTVRGIELFKARKVVTIVGLGHLSGDYYVSRVTHRIGNGRPYTMTFEVVRPGTGQLDDRFRGQDVGSRNRRDVTDRSLQAGTAEVVA